MGGPSDRCGYVHEQAEHFKPYQCAREATHDGFCLWHARVTGKPGDPLADARPGLAWAFPDDSADRWLDGDGERLDEAMLREANLRSVPLTDCTLMGANLSGATMRGGDAENADLRRADLSAVDARQCQLSNSVFENTDLSGADLRGADLSNAALRGADLSGTDLREAVLSGADLRRADLSEADLQGVELQGTRLFGVDLTEANLIDADLTGATLGDARLRAVSAVEAAFDHATLQDVDCTGADLRRADLTDADAVGADLTDAHLEQTRLSRAKLHEATLTGARLYGTVLDGVRINEGTTLGESVPYDPLVDTTSTADTPADDADLDSDGDTAPATAWVAGDAHGGPTPTVDGGYDVGDDHVDAATKAAGSYRSLAVLVAENEFPERCRHYRLRRKEIRRHDRRETGAWGAYLRSTLSLAVTRHGESPWRIAGVGAVVVGLFGLLYPFGLVESADGTRLTYGSDPIGVLGTYGEGLYVSVRKFTLGAPGYSAVGPGKLLAGAESLLGVVLVVVLVAVLVRRLTR
jgi:Uncharacterized low-complexity proteins